METWVDNEGGCVDFVGRSTDGQMILGRAATRPDGSKSLQRMVFKNITHDELDWSWEGSKDAAKPGPWSGPFTISASETVGRASDLRPQTSGTGPPALGVGHRHDQRRTLPDTVPT